MGSNDEGGVMTQINVERPDICCSIEVSDTSTQCVHCGWEMQPEHAHYKCPKCGNRDACCEGVY